MGGLNPGPPTVASHHSYISLVKVRETSLYYHELTAISLTLGQVHAVAFGYCLQRGYGSSLHYRPQKRASGLLGCG